ncbi:MAG: hypothetical protein IJW86_08695 [Clostridia bacterium]|nr:hypothetical protein [Clostridia bacterium]
MKKTVSTILAVILLFLFCNPTITLASDDVFVDWQDINLSESELNDILDIKTNNERATGLILTYSLGIKKDGNNLIIAGTTGCTSTVVKCGFKEVVIQRRANSTQEWTDYVTYKDLYDDGFSYMLGKSFAVGSGYQYRVTAIHYAKKNILMTQKIENTSNTVVFA